VSTARFHLKTELVNVVKENNPRLFGSHRKYINKHGGGRGRGKNACFYINLYPTNVENWTSS
jgi:hypothetical protein